MKLNAGVITAKLAESKDFYQRVLNFGVNFENDFYVLMHTPDQQAQFALLLPNHPSQQPIFQPAFDGKGMFLTIEVDDVDSEYKRIKDLGVNITVPIRDEPWGDRHFAVYDPNGVGIDIVKYAAPQ
ncbi:VOC family protein [Paraflavitalea speifideaquila]|uniref:VOC family protein n=1 Tax=Paraflavitalea speifideaquila TaxID=3076558 RepID=UPI0028EB9E49|nr:VOC family protein [Paraflavitalea speifideiaquila]